jgi:predicted PurR-regulated permease PerM
MTTGLSPEKVKQTFFLLSLALLGGMLAYTVREYISSFLGATTIYIIFRRPLYYLLETKKWPKGLAVPLLMVLSVLILIIPVGLLSVMLSAKAQYLVQHYAQFLQMVKGWNSMISERFNIDLLSDDTIGKVTDAGANIIPHILSATVSSLAQLAVLYFLLYFMMGDGRIMEKWVISNAPFKDENTQLLTHELKIQTLSNAIGIPILIIIIGALAGVGYWIFGMDQPLFWGVITGFADMIPLVGPAIIWIPVSLYLYFTGKHGLALGMAAFDMILLVNVEHLVRFTLLKKLGNTHPLVTFFGIIIGISVFGFLGLIFGPLLISYFMILLSIYDKEYLNKDQVMVELDPNQG